MDTVNTIDLNIYHTSDVHGSVLPIAYADNSKNQKGLAKISSIINSERENNPYTLLIDNGDILQGTPLTYFHAKIDKASKNPVIDVMNYMKYDAAIIGNHEFNYGQKYLLQAFAQSEFPWISANIVFKNDSSPLSGNSYIIKEFDNGLKIGIIGVTTKYIPNWENPNEISNLNFEDPVDKSIIIAKYLKEDLGVDIVIISYHGGFERDLVTGEPTENLTGENQGYEILSKVKHADVLLTGHQHRKIDNALVNGIITCQPSCNGEYLSKITLTLEKKDNKWQIISKVAKLIDSSKYEVDEQVIDLVKDIENRTQNWLDKPMGRINGNMVIDNHFKLRLKDNALIEFINKVQMSSSGASISNTALFDNKCVGFRENVTMRDIVSNYIYPNTLKVLKLKGKDIKAALEKSASYFCIKDGEIGVNPEFMSPKIQHYNYDMWEGIEYIIDASKPKGEKITKLTKNGKPIGTEEEFDVVMNNYRAGGGGDYYMYKDKPVVADIPLDMSELIANYILERKVIEATVNNNWKVIY
ncbi:bifunctional metallophosphatase/5'-nucleotidase [Clostridium sp. 19966]|uniref:bifunctional metallophosphatase/5'-nucleotidase n=1 Tax=Clostridium sp. 19966 TaxID=2768166 RepID=UPI0028DEBF14|nr:bifunctional UDP-sugar hydrolase/5'-nucleotidase [Clostridium sp. 19966]MDT8717197.1 bifunctional metallophosphatase/5'-nucleotidase [Clostridium sp. 19966]